MIDNLRINGLRGISQCHIDDIGRVNLFLGRNNCGKSTILESIFLLSGGIDPSNYIKINNLRNYRMMQSGEDFTFNIYGLQKETPIAISALNEGKLRKLTILYRETRNKSINIGDNNARPAIDYEILFHLENEGMPDVDTSIKVSSANPNKGKAAIAEAPMLHIPAFFISPSEPYENVESYFATIVENKKEEYVKRVINAIDPNIKDIVFAGNRIMADIGFEKRIPIQLMGDGLKKVLSVVVNMAMVPNGILLIDEVDNGLHYSSMPILWKAIVESAKMYNVQVFATTHNVESLRALNEILESDEYKDLQSDFRSYTIRREDNGEHKVIKAEYPQFNHIINQDLELR